MVSLTSTNRSSGHSLYWPLAKGWTTKYGPLLFNPASTSATLDSSASSQNTLHSSSSASSPSTSATTLQRYAICSSGTYLTGSVSKSLFQKLFTRPSSAQKPIRRLLP